MRMRLQRYLARAGIASRRKSEELIAAGLISVNGTIVTELGTKIDPESDEVAYRGSTIRLDEAAARSVILNKPTGVVTSRSDPRNRRTVYDLIDERGQRLIYVGRLDRESEGLLLLTTDGDLAYRLMHPRWGIDRVYSVELGGELDHRKLELGARKGIMLEDGRTGPFSVKVLEPGRRVEFTLREGKKREVRRIVKACGGTVDRLIRTRFGFLTLAGLKAGEWRDLDPEEYDGMRALVGLPDK